MELLDSLLPIFDLVLHLAFLWAQSSIKQSNFQPKHLQICSIPNMLWSTKVRHETRWINKNNLCKLAAILTIREPERDNWIENFGLLIPFIVSILRSVNEVNPWCSVTITLYWSMHLNENWDYKKQNPSTDSTTVMHTDGHTAGHSSPPTCPQTNLAEIHTLSALFQLWSEPFFADWFTFSTLFEFTARWSKALQTWRYQSFVY